MSQIAGTITRIGSAPSPSDRRSAPLPRDTTFRQVGERLRQSRAMVTDGLAEITVLTELRAEMTTARAFSVQTLSADARGRHRSAIRLASGASGGVEMW